MLSEAAPAKINLYLDVLGRRADGYHDLDSLVIFADVGERLDVRAGDGLSLSVSGPAAPALADAADNLVLRAARALRAQAGVTAGAALHLVKHIPVAAGLGGGSADAAAALRLLNRYWELGMSIADLARIGRKIGADVPACLHSRPLFFRGIGDEIEPAPALPEGLALVLVNPGVGVSTASVFGAMRDADYAPRRPAMAWTTAQTFIAALAARGNGMTRAAVAEAPQIATCLQELAHLPGCRLARMSGSGASCFALFTGEPPRAALARMRESFPRWWYFESPM